MFCALGGTCGGSAFPLSYTPTHSLELIHSFVCVCVYICLFVHLSIEREFTGMCAMACVCNDRCVQWVCVCNGYVCAMGMCVQCAYVYNVCVQCVCAMACVWTCVMACVQWVCVQWYVCAMACVCNGMYAGMRNGMCV